MLSKSITISMAGLSDGNNKQRSQYNLCQYITAQQGKAATEHMAASTSVLEIQMEVGSGLGQSEQTGAGLREGAAHKLKADRGEAGDNFSKSVSRMMRLVGKRHVATADSVHPRQHNCKTSPSVAPRAVNFGF